MDSVLGLLAVVALIGVPIYVYVTFSKGEILRFETLATPDEVLMTSVGQVGTARGWATVTQTPTNVALTYVRTPNIFIAFMLFITCALIPAAVVYWAIVSKKESLNIMMGDSPTGNTRIQITSNGWKGKSAGQAVRDAIGVAPGSTITEVVNEAPAIPGAATTPALPGASPLGLSSSDPAQLAGASTSSAPAIPAAWYDDPDDPSQHRYWDGSAWTEQRSPKG